MKVEIVDLECGVVFQCSYDFVLFCFQPHLVVVITMVTVIAMEPTEMISPAVATQVRYILMKAPKVLTQPLSTLYTDQTEWCLS